MEPLLILLAVAIGVLAGVLSGLFGIGGGLIVVPASIFLFGAGFNDAKAASLLVILASAGGSLLRHSRAGNVDAKLGLTLAVAGSVAGLVGVYVASLLSEFLLRVMFGGVMVIAAWRMRQDIKPRFTTAEVPLRVSLPVGFVAGLMPGLLGVGGGIVVVPALVHYGVGIHAAVGVSLAAVLANAAAASIGQAALGFTKLALDIGLPTALGALAGGLMGARLGLRTGSRLLSDAFSLLILIVAVSVAYSAFGTG